MKGSKLRAMKADVSFTGQNGATVASKPAVHVAGCGPGVSAALKGRRSQPHAARQAQEAPGRRRI